MSTGIEYALPSWVVLEPALDDEVCSYYPCGRKASYVALGPDYPYCTEHLNTELVHIHDRPFIAEDDLR